MSFFKKKRLKNLYRAKIDLFILIDINRKKYFYEKKREKKIHKFRIDKVETQQEEGERKKKSQIVIVKG